MAVRDERTMLRGSGTQRAQRASIDTGTGEKRLAGERAGHTSRGQFMDYYKDLGFSTTAQGAKDVRADEAKFQGQIKKGKAQVNEAQSAYDKAMGEVALAKGKIPTNVGKALESAYGKYSGGLTTINVVDPSGTKIEQSYRLPKEVATKLANEKGLASAWVGDKGNVFNISTRTTDGKIVGQELHTAMNDAVSGVKSKFYEQATPALLEQMGMAKKSIADAEAQLAQRGGEISAAKTMLAGQQQQRDQMWSDIRGDYVKKLDTMEQIFGNFKVEGKKEK